MKGGVGNSGVWAFGRLGIREKADKLWSILWSWLHQSLHTLVNTLVKLSNSGENFGIRPTFFVHKL